MPYKNKTSGTAENSDAPEVDRAPGSAEKARPTKEQHFLAKTPPECGVAARKGQARPGEFRTNRSYGSSYSWMRERVNYFENLDTTTPATGNLPQLVFLATV